MPSRRLFGYGLLAQLPAWLGGAATLTETTPAEPYDLDASARNCVCDSRVRYAPLNTDANVAGLCSNDPLLRLGLREDGAVVRPIAKHIYTGTASTFYVHPSSQACNCMHAKKVIHWSSFGFGQSTASWRAANSCAHVC